MRPPLSLRVRDISASHGRPTFDLGVEDSAGRLWYHTQAVWDSLREANAALAALGAIQDFGPEEGWMLAEDGPRHIIRGKEET